MEGSGSADRGRSGGGVCHARARPCEDESDLRDRHMYDKCVR